MTGLAAMSDAAAHWRLRAVEELRDMCGFRCTQARSVSGGGENYSGLTDGFELRQVGRDSGKSRLDLIPDAKSPFAVWPSTRFTCWYYDARKCRNIKSFVRTSAYAFPFQDLTRANLAAVPNRGIQDLYFFRTRAELPLATSARGGE